jgi:hypothetical protein
MCYVPASSCCGALNYVLLVYLGEAQSSQLTFLNICQTSSRHVPQLSGNGREDGQKGKYRREKSWDSEIVIDNQQKSGVREQSRKKRGYDFAARREKEHAARR